MELDKLQLSPKTVEDLYKNNIIKLSTSSNKKPVTENGSVKFLGGYNSGVLIIIRNAETAFLHDGELAFLTKVLTACKLTLADIGIVNINTFDLTSITNLKETMKPKKVIMCGVASIDLALPFLIPEFQVQDYDGVQYLVIPVLSAIEKDQALKKSLWVAFQKLFQL